MHACESAHAPSKISVSIPQAAEKRNVAPVASAALAKGDQRLTGDGDRTHAPVKERHSVLS